MIEPTDVDISTFFPSEQQAEILTRPSSKNVFIPLLIIVVGTTSLIIIHNYYKRHQRNENL
jgi:hypothetical protein